MKKALFILSILFFCINSYSQAPAIQWQKTFGGTGSENIVDIQLTQDGGYIVLAYTNSNNGDVNNNHGYLDFWVIKLDVLGNLEWKKTLGGSADDNANGIEQTSDGGYIIIGITKSNNGDVTGNHGLDDIWVVKIDASGNIQWQKTFGGSGYDYGYMIQQTSDSGYIFIGSTNSHDGDLTGNHDYGDFWVVKLDSIGTIVWQKTLGGSFADYGRSIHLTYDGGYIVGGISASTDGDVTGNHGFNDSWIVKLNSSGVIQWQKSLGGSNDDNSLSVIQTADGGYISIGTTGSNNGNITENLGLFDIWVVKLNPTGNIEWQKTLGGTNYDYGNDIQQTLDGKYVLTGFTRSNNGYITSNYGMDDIWVVKIDQLGNLIWEKTLGGTKSEDASSIKQLSDGSYVLAGFTNSDDNNVTINRGSSDLWVVKLGLETLSGTDFKNTFFSIFPNPTANLLNIQFSDQSQIEKLIITDLTGKIVVKQNGNAKQVNTENLAKGIYILEVFSSDGGKYQSKFIKQ